MKKRWMSLILAVVLIFGGCSMVSIDSDDLLYPPRPAGEQNKIQEALERHIGTQFTLKYPRSGEICSAITQEDLDRDGEEEVIAFYRTKTETGGTHFVLMDRVDGEWCVQSDLVGPGVDVDRLVITQFGTNKQKSILVGWILFNSDKIGTVYSYYDGKVVSSLSDHIYTEMLVNDFNGDGNDELFTLLLNSSGQLSTARLLGKRPYTDRMVILSELQLDGNISSYARIRFGPVETGGAYGVVIDENKNATTVQTELVYWDKERSRLVKPEADTNTSEDMPTNGSTNTDANQIPDNSLLRDATTLSEDISGNGIIDIPFVKRVAYSALDETGETVEKQCVFTRWKEYNAELKMFFNSVDMVVNEHDGYYLMIPFGSGWLERAYYEIDRETGTMTFWERGQNWEMFRIRAFSEPEWEKTGRQDYFEIARGNGLVYGGKVSARLQSELFGKDEAFFRNNIRLIGSKAKG